jgi:predicted dehydrogenase
VASSGALAMTAASYSRVMGANERINLGLIGAGDRGNHVMSLFQNRPEVHVVAVCDAWGERVESTRRKAKGAVGFADYRKLLETTPLDAVLIATPDHWHTKMPLRRLRRAKMFTSRSR